MEKYGSAMFVLIRITSKMKRYYWKKIDAEKVKEEHTINYGMKKLLTIENKFKGVEREIHFKNRLELEINKHAQNEWKNNLIVKGNTIEESNENLKETLSAMGEKLQVPIKEKIVNCYRQGGRKVVKQHILKWFLKMR
ncbi:hypothetical protein WA026_015523 [Henosepilachna vigintioctopunctata]|uniref:Uncharacterized protein n=1 Tax=Henosepilachna vigintioctopunctata TaxID=420089 RepID=A0AAW1VF28_9CUCU